MSDLTLHASDKGTYLVDIAFRNASGTLVTPKTGHWKLTKENGDLVREADISPLASQYTVVLSGNDLIASVDTKRLITITATYDDETYGNDLPLTKEARFCIDDFVNV